MKIAIFGDSFARILDALLPLNLDYINNSWPKLLEKNYEVANFGCPSSGLEWSYSQFVNQLPYITSSDKIIFCVSNIDRMYAPTINQHFIPNKNIFSHHKIHNKTANRYTKYFLNEAVQKNRHLNILKSLKKIGGDNILLLPCFNKYNNLQDTNSLFPIDVSLDEINAKEKYFIFNSFNHDRKLLMLYEKLKVCHLSTNTHSVLYSSIQGWIKTGKFNFCIDDIVVNTLENCLEAKLVMEMSNYQKETFERVLL